MGGRQRWIDRVCERERGGREGEREREGEGLVKERWAVACGSIAGKLYPISPFFYFFCTNGLLDLLVSALSSGG